ncbi:sodium-dependent bicarbonate transport family permease [Tsuneonella sp. SYSU-LHT278]|uniref:sodium-dependent bicarbonate transport family permease n=1 Tax=Tsuneonella sediminis TaxID=3416089 RepID=UPI003F7B236A
MDDPSLLAPFTSPVILFFILGAVASALRSDLAIPEAIAKGLSLYLMAAIGLKGGVAVSKSGIDATVAAALGAGLVLSLSLPFLAYGALRALGRLDKINAGAVAAHYGSVSVVTYVTATELLGAGGLVVAGFMVAVLAVMETPAILSGLFLARRGERPTGQSRGEMIRELFLNASVVLLLGSFAIGLITGPDGFEEVKPLFESGFKGVLCLFLLDMGLIAARRLIDSRALTVRLAALAIGLPLVNGTIAVALGTLLGLSVADAAALGVLGASASYIAVPAAMRLALPQADPGIYLTMSLSITFPFNVVFGIAIYAAMARALSGM